MAVLMAVNGQNQEDFLAALVTVLVKRLGGNVALKASEFAACDGKRLQIIPSPSKIRVKISGEPHKRAAGQDRTATAERRA